MRETKRMEGRGEEKLTEKKKKRKHSDVPKHLHTKSFLENTDFLVVFLLEDLKPRLL